jgi:hypothetical protein
MAKKLTSLGDDGSGGDNNDGPVELSFEMRDNLLSDLVESGQRSVWDLDEEGLAVGTVSLFVFNQISTVDEDLT